MSLAQEVNERTFEQGIEEPGVKVVDFGAPWCPPCRALSPVLDQLQNKYSGKVDVWKVNCDDSPELSAKYGIQSMPTVLVFRDGEPVEKLVGLRPMKAYETTIDRYL